MILPCKPYEEIVSHINAFKNLPKYCVNELIVKFPDVDQSTLQSIVSHVHQNRMKATHYRLKRALDKYYTLYMTARDHSPGALLNLAIQENIPPCLLARLILAKYCESIGKENVEMSIKAYLKNSTQIEDPQLAYDIFLCTIFDDLCSPFADTAKHLLGQQYEVKLYEEMTKHGLAYRNEEYLRNYGYDKTPDVKLEVPVAINGFVINWVESKALFGDDIAHKEYVQNQYSSYWNRFGPGLVIYWFGYLESIIDVSEKRFVIMDTFPEDIVQLQISPDVVPLQSNIIANW